MIPSLDVDFNNDEEAQLMNLRSLLFPGFILQQLMMVSI
jgi:hypothetical protein